MIKLIILLFFFFHTSLLRSQNNINKKYQIDEEKINDTYKKIFDKWDSLILDNSDNNLTNNKFYKNSEERIIKASLRKERLVKELYDNWYRDLLESGNSTPQALLTWKKSLDKYLDETSKEERNIIKMRIHGLEKRAQIRNQDHHLLEIFSDRELPMENISFRCQLGLNNCHAQTAVQLYDSYFKERGLMDKDFHSSAYLASLDDHWVLDGQVCRTLESLIEKGSTLGANWEGPLLNKINQSTELKRNLEEFHQQVLKSKTSKNLIAELCHKFSDLENRDINHSPDSWPSIQKKGKINFPGKVTCNHYQRKYLTLDQNNIILNRIHQSLNTFDNNPPRPIGVGLCAGFLFWGKGHHGLSKKISNFIFDSFKKKSLKDLTLKSSPFYIQKPDCSAHSLIISGRRFIKGRYEFKLRNSWGKDCQKLYHKDWHSKCNENGEVWVEEQDLVRNIFSLYWLE